MAVKKILVATTLCICATFMSADAQISGTLPVIHLTTQNGQEIVSKTQPVAGSLYITVPDESEMQPLGDEETQITLTIRGRGNSSWRSPKKPYKIKFNKRQEIFGLAPNKHFALLNLGYNYMASMAAMEAMRLLTGQWSPHIIPVELIMNGRYDGMYFLAETVRIDPGRLDIFKQNDLETDSDMIPYGWLVEIDNYGETNQIMVYEPGQSGMRVTYKSPELLSEPQLQWLKSEFNAMTKALYDKTLGDEQRTAHIDIKSAARYFVIRELFHDTDAYHGSLYLHRDYESDARWRFGPLWDIGFSPDKTAWIIDKRPHYAQCHLIGPLMENKLFMAAVIDVWTEFRSRIMPHMIEYIDEVARLCAAADDANHDRWPDIFPPDARAKAETLKSGLNNSAAWIDATLGYTNAKAEIENDENTGTPEYFNLQGIRVKNPRNGIFIERRGPEFRKIRR